MPMQRTMQIAWPAFLGACALEAFVFAVLDPLELQLVHSTGLSRQGVYSLSFFGFWAICAAACALAVNVGPPIEQD